MSRLPPRKTCLHLVVKASESALEGCRSQFDEGDEVLFLDDGVVHVLGMTGGTPPLRLSACSFSAEDLEARGLSGVAAAAGAQALPGVEAAALLLGHDLCVTWK
jgi:sulfur transfer complex TusBCD TusB component (DsrH family)